MKLFLLLISVLLLGVSPNISSASLQSSLITIDPQNIPPFVDKAQIIEGLSCGYCSSYTYSPWSACQSNNLQTKTLIEALPEGCIPSRDLKLTQPCSFCSNCDVAKVCQTGGGCDAVTGKCIPVVNVPSGQDPNNQCSSGFNACNGNRRIGPDGNCNGSGACNLGGLSEVCDTAGKGQSGGGCLDGSCLAVTNPIPRCGDGICNGDDTCSNCPRDCGLCPLCGDGTCNGNETCSNCSQDCGACTYCGDGIVQKPNTLGVGGLLNNGYEQCDLRDGITSNPYDSGPLKQYGCHASCVFKGIDEGGGFCGDTRCQTKYENTENCPSDCKETEVKWEYSDWSSSCNEDCMRTKEVTCVNRLSKEVVDNKLCEDAKLKREVTEKPCTAEECLDYSWQYFDEDWSDCSATCGGGKKTRWPKCVSELDEIVIDSFCLNLGLIKEEEEEDCNTDECSINPYWQYFDEDWSDCSATCGGGEKTRWPKCVLSNNVIDDRFCLNLGLTKEEEKEDCNTEECGPITQPTPSYKTECSDWSGCSLDCGGGMKTRTCWCESSLGVEVDEINCNPLNQKDLIPLTSEPCNELPCDDDQVTPYKWNYTNWSPAECSPGVTKQTRTAYCVTNDLKEKTVSDTFCKLYSKEPLISMCLESFR